MFFGSTQIVKKFSHKFFQKSKKIYNILKYNFNKIVTLEIKRMSILHRK